MRVFYAFCYVSKRAFCSETFRSTHSSIVCVAQTHCFSSLLLALPALGMAIWKLYNLDAKPMHIGRAEEGTPPYSVSSLFE